MSGEETLHLFNEKNICVKCELSAMSTRTLHCPEEPVDSKTRTDIFIGMKDYRFGVWVEACPYVDTFDPRNKQRIEKILTTLLLVRNKVIPIEAYRYQKTLIASYDEILKSN